MKIAKYAHTAKRLRDDPLGFLLDLLILVVANLLIPIPIVGNLLVEFRGFALGALGFLSIMALFVFMAVAFAFATPVLLASGYLETIFQSVNTNVSASESFADTQTPQQNPFGGGGLAFTTITAYFHDSSYYLTFGKVHTGVDLVPNDGYFQNSATYKAQGKVIILATISGHARYYIDEEGGKTVEITNDAGTLRVLNIHFSDVLVSSGEVKAGTPIGIMGHTGFATGDHLHYEIQVNQGSGWVAVDPLPYIH